MLSGRGSLFYESGSVATYKSKLKPNSRDSFDVRRRMGKRVGKRVTGNCSGIAKPRGYAEESDLGGGGFQVWDRSDDGPKNRFAPIPETSVLVRHSNRRPCSRRRSRISSLVHF